MTRRDQALLDLHQIQREAQIPANRRFFPNNDNLSDEDFEQFVSVMRELMGRKS